MNTLPPGERSAKLTSCILLQNTLGLLQVFGFQVLDALRHIFKKKIEEPFNILKVGMWRTVNEGGIKSRVWSPSGQEILASSGILEWKEDLDHLERQFTVKQPGTCDGYDLQQMKRDERVMRDTARLKQQKEAEEERLQNLAPSEKGKDESKVVRDCVLKWDAKDVVGAFAFDTPPSNTGGE